MIRSPSPRWLGLPWELLRDPERPGPLVLDRAGLSRSLPASDLADAFPVAGDRLRVLMVISRPDGPADVGYRMVARPLQERLDAVRGEVDLVVLRPPTLERLGQVLAEAQEAGEPFQIVHFDGHGVLPERPAGFMWGPAVTLAGGRQAEAMLAFEQPTGGADHAPAGAVARVLAEAQVPVVVLNACQSGAVGKELEAAVATRLLQEGTACVVAMAYTVYAVAAAEFMASFYERLFAGERIADAVAAGRRRMAEKDLRPSPPGELPLADWLVPVHYARREVTFPGLRTERPAGAPSLEELLDRSRERGGADQRDPLAPVGEFVGRDALFFTLEVAARLQHVVLLHGPGGTGKTELAKAFGRWWRDTGGVERPEWVIWHSFEPGLASFGLDGVITEVGMRVFGADFARLADPAERRAAVLELLASRRLLLIWDNFESVHAMPDPTGATPPLGDDEREELRRFLAQVAAGGSSAILLTSRSDEQWLGDIRRVPVPGLTREEASEYADRVLAPFPGATPRRREPEFADLMSWLDGHPLSLRLVLPHLDTTGPAVLLSALRGATDLPGDDPEAGRTRSLSASITYSYDHLPPDARRRLVALSLFQGVADATALRAFSQDPEVPARFAGCPAEDWTRLLEHAASVGLVSPLGAGMFRVHPALPGYLAARWRHDKPERYADERGAAEAALLHTYARLCVWLFRQVESGDAQLAFAVLRHQRRTLGALLGHAFEHRLWEQAQAVIQPLNEYWNADGLHEEAQGWVDRARLALEGGDGALPALDTPAGALWLFVVGSEANRAIASHRLESAERAHLDIRNMLERQPASAEQQHRRSIIYHQSGMVAQLRGRLGDAEDWYHQSLTILRELGDRTGMASCLHQLGVVAQLRGRLDQAEERYRRSLTIWQQLGNRPGIANCFHQLGTVAQRWGRLDEAEEWYRRSLTIRQEFNDRAGMAKSLHQIGRVAEVRGRLDEAEEWYRRSLTIRQHLGDRPGIANCFHQLGTVAQRWGRLDEAEEWYRQSLTIEEELGNRPGMALTFGQLGLLTEERGQRSEALMWTVRCVALFEDFPHPATGPGPEHLARLTAELGIEALEQCWREVTGNPLPQVIRDYVERGGDQ